MNNNKYQFSQARCYWITGLSASGKTTMANKLTEYLKQKNKPVVQLIECIKSILNIKAYFWKDINTSNYSLV